MSQATALTEARKLQAIMQKHGVNCTIELKVGRTWSGDDWYSRKHVVMNHHTAGSASGLTPSYGICRNGRTGLPGPLCNGYGGRDKVYRIVTMGLANHPGTGGPLTLDGFTIPKDSARITAWGTEWEHTGVHPWPADMVDFMARSNAALNEYHGIGLGRQCEHSTWTSRKIDRNGYTAQRGRDEIARVLKVVERPLLEGAILAKHKSLPVDVKTKLGKVTTAERGTPDGRGRFNHFEGGSIYWTPQTGAHPVYGRIREAWAKEGWERSIGYPVDDEHAYGAGRKQHFEGGNLTWVATKDEVWLSRLVKL